MHKLPAPDSPDSLTEFLKPFALADLGQGDPVVGCNLLTAMTVALANLAPDDGSVHDASGLTARLGASLLVTGPASAGHVEDEVLSEISRRQNNLSAHLVRYLDKVEAAGRDKQLAMPPLGRDTNEAENLLMQMQSNYPTTMRTETSAWSEVFATPPAEQILHLVRCPKFHVAIARPADFDDQLKGIRPGRPLVHLGLTRPADFAAYSEPGAALLEGRYANGAGGRTIRANIVLTDALGMLREAAKNPDERTAWLQHFVWLADGDAGPDLPAALSRGTLAASPVKHAFLQALGAGATRRMNPKEKSKAAVVLNMNRRALHRWTAFLTSMEPALPGISGAARHLLASLVYGFNEMAATGLVPAVSVNGVEAFAGYMVKRMVNARSAILHAAETARRRSQIERVVRKLLAGTFDARTIYNHLNITAAECEACLKWLDLAGMVRQKAGKWSFVEGAKLNFNDCHLPVIEI